MKEREREKKKNKMRKSEKREVFYILTIRKETLKKKERK